MKKSSASAIFRSKLVALFFVIIGVAAVFYILNNNYLGKDNIRGMLNTMSLSGTLAVGMTCLLISGGVDLSAGAEACLGGIVCCLLLQAGLPWPLAMLFAVISGGVMGCLNAFLINRLNFMGFIATIGTTSIFSGVANVITNGQNVSVSNEAFWRIGSTTIFVILPLPFVIMIVLIAVYGFILTFTRFGRSCYICGGNLLAARLSGLNPKKISSLLYINSGALAALGGSVLAARMRSAAPGAAATGALDAITAAVLGGVSFAGGAGGMGGCIIGLFLLTAFNNGLVVVGLQSYWQIVAQGVLLIIALCLDFINEKARVRALKD
ncbi:MAG: ABC transporter permease [Oscillospiraceae bacterium]|jgi:ribose transport system permease protein|nr:ABC transporter permease [Oscillospiraceae bacterium]